MTKFLISGFGVVYRSARKPCNSSPPVIPSTGWPGPGKLMYTISVISLWYSIDCGIESPPSRILPVHIGSTCLHQANLLRNHPAVLFFTPWVSELHSHPIGRQ